MRTLQSRASTPSGSPQNSSAAIPATTPPLIVEDARFEIDTTVITDLGCAAARLAAYQAELQKLTAKAALAVFVTPADTLFELHILRFLFAVKVSTSSLHASNSKVGSNFLFFLLLSFRFGSSLGM